MLALVSAMLPLFICTSPVSIHAGRSLPQITWQSEDALSELHVELNERHVPFRERHVDLIERHVAFRERHAALCEHHVALLELIVGYYHLAFTPPKALWPIEPPTSRA